MHGRPTQASMPSMGRPFIPNSGAQASRPAFRYLEPHLQMGPVRSMGPPGDQSAPHWLLCGSQPLWSTEHGDSCQETDDPSDPGTFNLIEHTLTEGPDPLASRGGPVNQAPKEASLAGSAASPSRAMMRFPKGPKHLLQVQQSPTHAPGVHRHSPICMGTCVSPPPQWLPPHT